MSILGLLLWILLGATTAHAAPLAQASARVMVTVVDASGQPVGGTTVRLFVERAPEPVGECTTDAAGYCEIVASGVPTIGGAIRGSLRIGEGRRPVIWNGGDFTITLQLDETGFLMGPVDFVTPVNEATLTVAAQETGTPGAASATTLPEGTSTPESTLTPEATATASPVATASPATPTETPTATPGPAGGRGRSLIPLILALVVVGALALYFYLTDRRGRAP